MRGPLLSGPLGTTQTLDALVRWTKDSAPVAVLGPPWLGDALAKAGRALLLIEPPVRPQAVRTRRRAQREQRPLDVAMAGSALPLRPRSLGALVAENVAGLGDEDAARWLAGLVPALRPGGRLIAADATSSTAAAARVAGAFLSVALTGIVQEWPREGAVLTIGVAPVPSVVAARFGLSI
jgi:hypothetical protein